VVSGEKTFLLIPPTDQPFVPYGEYANDAFDRHIATSHDTKHTSALNIACPCSYDE